MQIVEKAEPGGCTRYESRSGDGSGNRKAGARDETMMGVIHIYRFGGFEGEGNEAASR